MGLSFLKTKETRDGAARAARARSWTSSALLLSLWWAACAPADTEDTGRSVMPSVPATGGAAWPPAGTGGAALGGAMPGGAALGGASAGGAAVGGTWPMANDAGVGALPDAGPTARPCNRDIMGVMIDRFFLALKAHDTSSLPFARDVKFTENGRQLKLGEGIWKTAGATTFKHTAYDVETCNTVTEAVIAEGAEAVPAGLRLRFAPPAPGTTASPSQEILEVEMLVARSGTYAGPSDPTALAAAGESEMWEQLVPASQRATRAQLEQLVDDYFVHFPAGACHFAPQCVRLENGFSPGACSVGLSCAPAGVGQNARPRLKVIDVEAGIAVALAMFSNASTINLFRVRGAQIQAFHALLTSANTSGW